MKLCVVGSGCVGLTTGICFADLGNDVFCIDIDRKKVDMINRGESPIYEPGMEEVLKRNIANGRLRATTDYSVVKDCEVSFICVGTPSKEDGSINLRFIDDASRRIGEQLKDSALFHTIVVRSTVIPGTCRNIVIPAAESSSGKKAGVDFGVCMNPEHLAEGTAMKDFTRPDKIVIGRFNEKSSGPVEKAYAPFRMQERKMKELIDPAILENMVGGEGLESKIKIDTLKALSLEEAEMEKYCSNTTLANKVSMANELANIAEIIGVDYFKLMKVYTLDRRIGSVFRRAGAGYGGSCFTKDLKALMNLADALGYEAKLLKRINKLNEKQAKRMAVMAERLFGLKGKKVALLGLSFKPDTDDMRDAPSLKLIKNLLGKGASVTAYDPKATENAKRILGDSINFTGSKEECVEGADVVMLATEWKEFSDKAFLSGIAAPFIDGRGFIDPKDVREYYGIGRGKVLMGQ